MADAARLQRLQTLLNEYGYACASEEAALAQASREAAQGFHAMAVQARAGIMALFQERDTSEQPSTERTTVTS